MTLSVLRFPFSLDPLIAEAKRRARRRRLLAVVAVLIAGGALGAAFAVRSSNGSGGAGATVASRQIPNPVPAVASNCGRGVPGRGFHVFACMSGGARAGHPHPKELLVVRSDGSSVAYPAFRVGEFAVGDGEVVATYDANLVRVTSSGLVPLLTKGELARALHIRAIAIADIYVLTVDAHGDIYFVASMLSRSGCENRVLERTTGGPIHQIRASSTSGNNTCG
jgi:hypothetical protein